MSRETCQILSLEHPFVVQWESTPLGLAKNSLSTRDWLAPQLLVLEWLVAHIYSNHVKLTILVSTICIFSCFWLAFSIHSWVLLELQHMDALVHSVVIMARQACSGCVHTGNWVGALRSVMTIMKHSAWMMLEFGSLYGSCHWLISFMKYTFFP